MANFDLSTYIPVHERLVPFRKDHPTWGLHAELVTDDGQRVLMRAVVTDEDGRTIAVGWAEEVRGAGPVNKTSAVENAETSAWGRALANLGYEVTRGIASREEVERAQRPAPKVNPNRTRLVDRHGSLTEDQKAEYARLREAANMPALPPEPDEDYTTLALELMDKAAVNA